MKHFFRVFSTLALVAVASVSCSEIAPSGNDTDTPFDTPANWKEAVKMLVTTPNCPYMSLEMCESGLFIIRTHEGVHTGNYRFKHPVYTCDGFGELEVVETTTRANDPETVPSRITIRRSGAEPITVTITVVKGSSTVDSAVLENLCRSWKPEKTIISVSGGDLPPALGVAHALNGCDLPAIQEYLAGNGLLVDADLTGYVVRDVTFTQAGTFLIRFTGAEPYEGDYALDANSSFRYTFEGAQVGNPLINTQAEGNVTFEKSGGKNICEITIHSELDVEAGYKGKIIIRLAEQ